MNQDAYFSEGDVLCVLGDPSKMEAIIVIDQSDIDLVKVGDEVELMLESAQLNSVTGKISRISQSEMKESPKTCLYNRVVVLTQPKMRAGKFAQ